MADDRFESKAHRGRRSRALPAIECRATAGLQSWRLRIRVWIGCGRGLRCEGQEFHGEFVRVPERSRMCKHVPGAKNRSAKARVDRDMRWILQVPSASKTRTKRRIQKRSFG